MLRKDSAAEDTRATRGATISRHEFDTKRRHQYAGWRDDQSYELHGLPLYDAWWLEYDPKHGTMLVFGRIEG